MTDFERSEMPAFSDVERMLAHQAKDDLLQLWRLVECLREMYPAVDRVFPVEVIWKVVWETWVEAQKESAR